MLRPYRSRPCLNVFFSKESEGLTDLQIDMIRGSWEKVAPNKKHHGQLLFHKYDQYDFNSPQTVYSEGTSTVNT